MSGGERIFTCCEVKGYSLYEGQRTLAIRRSKDTYLKEVKGYSHVMRSNTNVDIKFSSHDAFLE
jgi:hypothetical protein